MGRIILTVLLVLTPILTGWLILRESKTSSPIPELHTRPAIHNLDSLLTPDGYCNYQIPSGYSSPPPSGIFGDSTFNGTSATGTLVVLLDVNISNAPIATATVLDHSGFNSPYRFFFPDTTSGSNYQGALSITNTLQFKLKFIPPTASTRPVVFFPEASTLEDAATLTFDTSSCNVIDKNTQSSIGLNPINQKQYNKGAIAGKVILRDTNYGMSNITVSAYPPQTKNPDLPDVPLPSTATSAFNGNFILDPSSSGVAGTTLYLRFSNLNFITYWYSFVGKPVDKDQPNNLSIEDRKNLIRVLVSSTDDYSKVYFPASAQTAGTIVLARITA